MQDSEADHEHTVRPTDIHPIVDATVLHETEDLLKLSELHESTMLNNIRTRFKKDIIYVCICL